MVPVRDTGGKAGSGGVDTQDVVSTQLLYLPLHRLKVSAKLISLQNILNHHRFKPCTKLKMGKVLASGQGQYSK